MVGTKIKVSLFILFLGLFGCAAQDSTEIVDLLTAFDFADGSQSWEGGISDYPVGYNDSLVNVDYSIKVLSNLPLEGSDGLRISADNPHGDLFYFFKREIRDLVPNKRYKIDFEFLVYTQLLTQSDKLSSEELYLKIGAVNYEPDLQQVNWQNALEYMVLNVDKGETNAESGDDIVNVGSIKELTSKTAEAISGNTYDFLIEVVSDKEGVIWLVIGVDSGIKSQLTFGMSAFTAYFREQN